VNQILCRIAKICKCLLIIDSRC